MKNKNILYILLAVIIIGVVWYAFKGYYSNPSTNNLNQKEKLQVSTSFYPLYFFAQEIGGDKVEVKNITPAGAEPHDYDPSTRDIADIEKGDMLILNGSVETWGDKVKDNLKGSSVKIVTAGEGLFTGKDPHVWLNPRLAKKESEKITESFSVIDPVNKLFYQENQKQLNNKFDDLDSKYIQGLQNCQSKDFITSHVAFAYLAEVYGLNQVAISGLSPDAEPSAKDLAIVAEFAKKNNVKYIFFETLVSPELSETIAGEIGAQTLVLDPLEGISDDDIKQGKNYFTVMEDNLKNLQISLQCSN